MIDLDDFFPELIWPFDPRIKPLPPPAADVCAAPCVTICMNAEWWSHVSGQITRLLYRDAWAGTEDEVHAAIGSIYKILDLGDATMGCGCGGSSLPFPTRIGANGQVQVSYDGGTTWVDAPQYDPRTNVTQLPPVTGENADDAKCKAANSAVAYFQQIETDAHAKRAAAATVAQIAEAIIAFLVVVGIIASFGALAALGGALAAIVASATAADFDAAFTNPVWADLLCRIYCALESDGTMTDEKFNRLIGQVKTDHPGIAGDFLSGTIQMVGKSGLINASRLGLNAGLSCNTCACPVACAPDIWSIFGAGHGVIDSVDTANGQITVHGTDPGNGNYYCILKTPNINSCCSVLMVEFATGAAEIHGWTDCGQPQVEGVPQHTGLGWGSCINYMQLQSGAPFTATITFVDCP